jgi:hypothetical protein
VTATSRQAEHATRATSAALLNFDVIKERAGQMLGLAAEEVTDGALGALFGLDRGTIWRFRHGEINPRFETVSGMADVLGLAVDDIRAQSSPPRPQPSPAAPSTPKPPAGPKPKADR